MHYELPTTLLKPACKTCCSPAFNWNGNGLRDQVRRLRDVDVVSERVLRRLARHGDEGAERRLLERLLKDEYVRGESVESAHRYYVAASR